MGLLKFTITVEADVAPKIFLGSDIGGAIVVGMQQEKVELVSAADIAQRNGLSVATVRRRLSAINQGTEGKFLYDPVKASQLLKENKSKRGRKRAC